MAAFGDLIHDLLDPAGDADSLANLPAAAGGPRQLLGHVLLDTVQQAVEVEGFRLRGGAAAFRGTGVVVGRRRAFGAGAGGGSVGGLDLGCPQHCG